MNARSHAVSVTREDRALVPAGSYRSVEETGMAQIRVGAAEVKRLLTTGA